MCDNFIDWFWVSDFKNANHLLKTHAARTRARPSIYDQFFCDFIFLQKLDSSFLFRGSFYWICKAIINFNKKSSAVRKILFFLHSVWAPFSSFEEFAKCDHLFDGPFIMRLSNIESHHNWCQCRLNWVSAWLSPYNNTKIATWAFHKSNILL